MRDMKKSWASSRAAEKRAAEYDVIYDRLKAKIVQLTKEKDQPQTMDDAVEEVLSVDKVCLPGGITMYTFMNQCRDERKAEKAAKAAAVAAAAAQQQEGDEQEGGTTSESDS
jgi:hypothetical protein